MVTVLAALLLAVVALACGRGDSDDPVAGAEAAPGEATVTKVTDGDTIRVRISGQDEPVRLIGIDTPETHGQGGLRECYGSEASARTAALLPIGSKVRLVRDAEARDRYGRLLAYVYRDSDDLFVNLTLAREGYAAVLTIPPNVAHTEAFVSAAARARDEQRGLWGRCGGADTPLG